MKNTLLAVAMILVFSSQIFAQSASKMEVNVNVKSGVTLLSYDDLDVEYTGFTKDMAAIFSTENEIEFLTHPNTEIIIEQQEMAELQNEFGEHMIIFSKIDDIDLSKEGFTALQISSSVDFEYIPRGTYKGDYSTSIEYL